MRRTVGVITVSCAVTLSAAEAAEKSSVRHARPSPLASGPTTPDPITIAQRDTGHEASPRAMSLNLPESRSSGDLRPSFGINLGIFGDANYATERRDDNHHSFSIGDLDLYSTVNLGSRIDMLAELVMDHRHGESTSFHAERLWIGYTFADFLIVRAGRHHTALGYWNKTYHHGRQLYLTVDRPFFLAFEHDRGVVPIHIVGLELEGSLYAGPVRLRYELNLGNGPDLDATEMTLIPNNISDNNNSKQLIVRLSAQPARYAGMTAGIFGTKFSLDTPLQPGLAVTIMGADLSYQRGPWDLIGEYFRFRNSSDHADAFYLQFGHTFLDLLTPYLRYEYIAVDPSDPYFSALNLNSDRRQQIIGVRYDLRRGIRIALPVLALALTIGLSEPRAASTARLAVIVNSTGPLTQITVPQVRHIYLGEMRFIQGTEVIPFHAAEGDIKAAFLRQILGQTPRAHKLHWIKKVFQESHRLPRVEPDPTQTVDWVSRLPGAIAYVPEDLVRDNPDIHILMTLREISH